MNAAKLVTPLMLMGMFLTACMAISVRNLVDAGLSLLDVAFLRLSISAAVMILALLMTRKIGILKVRPRDMPFFVLFGAFKFLSDYTLFRAFDSISVGLAALLQNTAPYFVMIVSFFLFRERVGKMTLMAVMLGTFGCILISGKALMDQSMDVSGMASAILSAFFLGIFFIGSRINIDKGYTPATYLVLMFLFATLVSLPFADIPAIGEGMTDLSVLGNSLALGILMTLIPYYIMSWSVKHISQVYCAVLAVSEVIFAVIIGVLYFGEGLDVQDVLGVAMLVASVAMISFLGGREKKDSDGTDQVQAE